MELDRRRFLRTSAAAAASVVAAPHVLSGCADGQDVAALADSVTGRLILPGDPAFEWAATPHNLATNSGPPSAILFAADADDVSRALSYARDNNIPLVARGGGHSYAGYSTTPGLQVSLAAMSDVSLFGDVATVGAGAVLVTVYEQLAQSGRLLPAGSCPTVGIAGFALGGGFGFESRQYGMLSDRMCRATVVLADGSVVEATDSSEPDLFWALRGGGGGNFGIVTEFGFETSGAADVSVFQLIWNFDRAIDVFAAWQDLIATMPSELTPILKLINGAGSGSPTVQVVGQFVGSEAELRDLIQPLAAIPDLTTQSVDALSWIESVYFQAGCTGIQQCQREPVGKAGSGHAYYKSAFTREPYGNDALETAIDAVANWPLAGVTCVLEFDSYGGAINDVDPTATAFVHRDELFLCQYQAYFSGDDPFAATSARAALTDVWERLAPYNSGFSYQNYIDPLQDNWQQAYYGENLDRLIDVKTQYDPTNFFSFAQSIPVRA
ncbi:MAG: FAD-binding oxidoreductase [Actinomycetota bacterium]